MKKTYRIKDGHGGYDIFETDLEKKGAARYKLNGKSLTGVTTALGTIAKPALIDWSARLCSGEAFKIAVNMEKIKLNEVVVEILKKPDMTSKDAKYIAEKFPEFASAISAHRKKSGAAMDTGRIAHQWVEDWAKAKMVGKEIAMPSDEKILRIVAPFINWIEGSVKVSTKKGEWDFNSVAIVPKSYKVLASEQSICSRKFWYSGTFDLVLEITWDDAQGVEHTGKFVVDFKTSGGIYGREYFAQCAAYRNGLEEMDWDKGLIAGSIIIRSGKEGNDFEVAMSTDYLADFRFFKAALTLYKDGYCNFDVD